MAKTPMFMDRTDDAVMVRGENGEALAPGTIGAITEMPSGTGTVVTISPDMDGAGRNADQVFGDRDSGQSHVKTLLAERGYKVRKNRIGHLEVDADKPGTFAEVVRTLEPAMKDYSANQIIQGWQERTKDRGGAAIGE